MLTFNINGAMPCGEVRTAVPRVWHWYALSRIVAGRCELDHMELADPTCTALVSTPKTWSCQCSIEMPGTRSSLHELWASCAACFEPMSSEQSGTKMQS